MVKYRAILDNPLSKAQLFKPIREIGGTNGWYYMNWVWRVRGFFDEILGGVGLRRGRENQSELKVGSHLDFWRVVDYVSNEKLILKAEMKIPGEAWLEFNIELVEGKDKILNVIGKFIPNGLLGYLYWYTFYPIHNIIFNGMANAIVKKSSRFYW